MQTALHILDWLGYASTILVIVSTLVAIWLCARGFVPVLIRLGNGLWRRKIAIFAKNDSLISLTNLLRDSRLFNHTNVLQIPNETDFGVAESASVFLVHWPDWKDDVEKILARKKDGTALIVYAPREHGPIPEPITHLLEKHRNVVVSNFRSRLLNDMVLSMITTGYEKRRG